MKRLLISITIALVALGMVACSDKKSVSTVNEHAKLNLDKSIYQEKDDQSDEKKAARECLEYMEGLNGKEIDFFKAAEIIKPYENSEDPDILYCRGFMHRSGCGLPLDYDVAKEELEKAELGGNYYASIQLGYIYKYGSKNIDRDYSIAREYFRRAILNGRVEGYIGLGELYRDGCGVEKDIDLAKEYITKVIDEGSEQFYISDAICDLGILYYKGELRDETEENDIPEYEKAVEYFEEATHVIDSKTRLAICYREGIVYKKDIKKYKEMIEEGANIGVASAMRDLGLIYAYGYYDTEKDFDKAFEWFNKAIDLKLYSAAFELGKLYEAGTLVEKDMDKANEYYNLAYDLGYED
ncbi:MAG: sel1 repeat family protein [Butyrivibrio sp.]|nr:sel1 repeat family protein [Butyrivibrio sp.]